jgi:hypothetical protein
LFISKYKPVTQVIQDMGEASTQVRHVGSQGSHVPIEVFRKVPKVQLPEHDPSVMRFSPPTQPVHD